MRYAVSIVTAVLILSCCGTGERAFNEKEWRRSVEGADPASLYATHFRDGEYFNPWMPMEDRGFFSFLMMKIFGKQDRTYSKYEKEYLPPVLPGVAERIREAGDRDFIMWAGHASFLMRIAGEYWLTDPMFSEKAVIIGRKTPPGIVPEDLRRLEGRINVVISHNHYDHLDVDSIRALPALTRFYVPMGLKSIIEQHAKGPVTEMDWWEELDTGGARVICLPAQHWSRRIFQGKNTTLWASWLLVAGGRTVYFAGDSGYFIGYREIGRKYGRIDYALLPVTAFHPRHFMHYAHMNTGEALDAFSDLGAGYFIPTQWGTFTLGEEPAGFGAIDLRRAVKDRGLDDSRFLIMDIGGIVYMGE